jgi:polysaccharide deacetylase family protein (PEP-CTERM system associated)
VDCKQTSVDSSPAINTLSVDVEEYFHAANLATVAPPKAWRTLPHRADIATRQIIELFERCNIQATFFILGYVAQRFPVIVKELAARGHEIASHGYAHQLAYEQTPQQFRRDIVRSRKLLQDLSGQPVNGYRAPNFSIRQNMDWAYDCLIESGYHYDSSIYPVWHPRYANTTAPNLPYIIARASGKLFEFPLATTALSSFGQVVRLPTAGGAYWRLLPGTYTRWALKRILQQNHPVHCYVHPWELDSGQPFFLQLPYLTQFRHYGRISSFASRLESLLKLFRVTTFAQAIPLTFPNHSFPDHSFPDQCSEPEVEG